MRNPIVITIEEKLGDVNLTANEAAFIVRVVTSTGGRIDQGSTYTGVVRKIREATGWELKPVCLICRFAYRNGMVRL